MKAALFCMPEAGHARRLLSLIAGLAEAGIEPHAFTDQRFAAEVQRSGGRFQDLFAHRPLEEADAASTPFPCRYVSFAGHYAESVIAELRELRPSVVVYDTFAVVGPVAARELGLPYVNVCAGHNMNPGQVEALIANHPRVDVSDRCHAAVETLRDRYGMDTASPFSYLTGLSPQLNLYCEPAEFLTAEERSAFEPVAFFGSLPSDAEIESRSADRGPSTFGRNGELRLYASFGTVAWRYWADQALDALRAISAAVGELPRVEAVISVGGAALDSDARRTLAGANVAVADYVDQWRALEEADAFITHQGLNSTHEAILHRVPMVSYPFFSDQPALARRCAELGVAVPLTASVREPPTPADVNGALEAVSRRRGRIAAALEEARQWERRTVAGRPAVIERIAALVRE